MHVKQVPVLLSLGDHRDIPAILKVSTEPMQRLMHVLTADAEKQWGSWNERLHRKKKQHKSQFASKTTPSAKKTIVGFV